MKKGFSFIEILTISFIVISLVAMVLGLFSRSRALSRSMVCLNNLRQISMAIENYQVDWKSSPNQLYSLFPNYIKDKYSFKCPEDKSTKLENLPSNNSYGNFYVNRSFNDEDVQKMYLYCPRHFNEVKGVGAFLSYSASIVQNKSVTRDGANVKFGEVYTGGTFKFADGTIVTADPSLIVGVGCSFVTPDNKFYSIMFVPEGSNGSLTVNHQGDSRFEIVTPALIAGVSGTIFTINNIYNSSTNQATTSVSVTEGKVLCEDRTDGTQFILNTNDNIVITVQCQSPGSSETDKGKDKDKTKSIPEKPEKKIKVSKK